MATGEFDINCPWGWTARDGTKVSIISTYETWRHRRPITAAYAHPSGLVDVFTLTPQGRWYEDGRESPLDLINKSEKTSD